VAQGGDWGALITDLMGFNSTSGIGRHPQQHAGRGSPEIDKMAFC